MIDVQLMLTELIRDEGMRLVAYDDATGRQIRPGTILIGHPSIGIGRCLDTDGMTKAEVVAMAQNDIAYYLGELAMQSWFPPMDPVRQRAIVNMRHELGMRGLLGFREMIAALSACDWEMAADVAADSLWARSGSDRAKRVLGLLRNGADTAEA